MHISENGPKHHFVCTFKKPFYVIYHSFPFPNKYYDLNRRRQGKAQEFGTLVYGLGTSFDNVLVEHGELPFILPLAVHLDSEVLGASI